MKNSAVTACLDANIFISGIAFGGKPLKILDKALAKEFRLVSSTAIFKEVSRNLTLKLGLNAERVEKLIVDFSEISSLYEASGKLCVANHEADDAVIEVALMGGCDFLVTGDKKHLLPLASVEQLKIVSPSRFLDIVG